ncbi:tetratricopeptide repeat protein [Parolsenella sp. LCP21S3_E11]|uniref:tetratricopeptide repeat protein n=1 Tax=Parolsenella sp. LCP21S3_E11 TaxID=3438797 RepID=UPI003F97B570
MVDESKYAATLEEEMRAARIANVELTADERGAIERLLDGGSCVDVDALLREMGEAAFSSESGAFSAFVARNHQRIYVAAADSDDVSKLLFLGYKMGISRGDAACMNGLGALYYMGDLVEQDYAKAAELYEMAMNHGCYQSIINLGYIWEYGRTGERDYQKAYQYYALAAALADSSEAAYKLGDMYSRGKFVERDMAKAYQLWSRSLDLAEDIVEIAQPAIRIAQLLLSEDCESAGAKRDPMRVLQLFQQAEIGLRIDIDNGQTYYRKRLEEAIEGQEKARAIIDGQVIDGPTF